jgi:hypothetical protein
LREVGFVERGREPGFQQPDPACDDRSADREKNA